MHLHSPGLDVIKLEYILKLKIKRNDWLHSQPLHFILSLRMNSSFIALRPGSEGNVKNLGLTSELQI